MNYPLSIIKIENDIDFTVKYDKLKHFIEYHAPNNKFVIMINFGFISQGKSTFSQKISGVKHKIGNELTPETIGALISYCGTIQDIINRFDIKELITSDLTIHVFNIDTEGILYDKNEKVTKFLLPLIQTSSLLIGYNETFTDLSLVPILRDIYQITNINMLITIKNSHSIIKNDNISISEYLRLAQMSSLSQKLKAENINSSVIPCIDFRDDVQHEFSNIMNNYFISRVLNSLSNKQWDNSSIFIG